jgi:cob(I)alamin adenosyltransferase
MSPEKGFGRVHVITGNGRGKTTAAFGLAMRAAGHGAHVCIVQMMKAGETTGEVIAAKRLGNIKVAQFGTGSFVIKDRITSDDKQCALEAVSYAKGILENGKCSLLVLDEVNLAVSFGLVGAAEIIQMLKSRAEGIEVVLTGREAPQEFIDYADYVSVIEGRKHPFDDGQDARKGIEW